MINGEKICNNKESSPSIETTTTPDYTTTFETMTTSGFYDPNGSSLHDRICLTEDLDALFHSDDMFEYAGFKINWRLADKC